MRRDSALWGLALAIAGCGRVSFQALPDAALERGPLQFTTTVEDGPTSSDMPISNVALIIADADGVVQDMVASANGGGTVIVERGWSVTAVFPCDAQLSRAPHRPVSGD